MKRSGKNKVCSHCRAQKLVSEFYRNRSTVDGYEYACKTCSKKMGVKYRRANIEKVQVTKAAWRKRNPDKERAYHKKWRISGNDSYVRGDGARHAVLRAIKNGVLVRQPCSVCGEKKSQAHHPDYGKPLSVVWLCTRHHQRTHAGTLSN